MSIVCSLYSSAQVSLSQSLTACYALDGNANEPINALTGTLSAVTPTVNRFLQPNTALAFNGSTSSFVRLPNNALIKPTAVSLSCWVKTNIGNTIQYVVFTTNGCGSYYEGYTVTFAPFGSTYRFQIVKSASTCSSGGQISLFTTSTSYSANTWYHVGAYLGPDSLKLYVNGVLDGTLANPNPLAYGSTTNVYLGGTNQSPNFPLNGSIDNLRIYNRKLSGTEFNQLFTLDPICQPAPTAAFVMTPSVTACTNQSITLMGTGTNSATAYSWTMTGGTPSSSSTQNTSTTFTAPGVYTVSLVASNSFGSSAPYSQTINISSCVGINESSFASTFSIYPNPAKEEFMIGGLERGTSIEVYNTLGSLIYMNTAESEKEKINLGNQKAGIYFVKLSLAGKTHTTKLIKE